MARNGGHLDEGEIHAWLDGALSPAESAWAAAHVESCPACAASVAEARGLIAATTRILTALDDVPGGVLPGAMTPGAAASGAAPAGVASVGATGAEGEGGPMGGAQAGVGADPPRIVAPAGAGQDASPIDLASARRRRRPGWAAGNWPIRAAAALLVAAVGTLAIVQRIDVRSSASPAAAQPVVAPPVSALQAVPAPPSAPPAPVPAAASARKRVPTPAPVTGSDQARSIPPAPPTAALSSPNRASAAGAAATMPRSMGAQQRAAVAGATDRSEINGDSAPVAAKSFFGAREASPPAGRPVAVMPGRSGRVAGLQGVAAERVTAATADSGPGAANTAPLGPTKEAAKASPIAPPTSDLSAAVSPQGQSDSPASSPREKRDSLLRQHRLRLFQSTNPQSLDHVVTTAVASPVPANAAGCYDVTRPRPTASPGVSLPRRLVLDTAPPPIGGNGYAVRVPSTDSITYAGSTWHAVTIDSVVVDVTQPTTPLTVRTRVDSTGLHGMIQPSASTPALPFAAARCVPKGRE